MLHEEQTNYSAGTKGQAEESPLTAEQANESPLAAEQTEEKPLTAEETNERPLTAEQAKELAEAALRMRARSYHPYSGFAVGAALLTAGGRIYTGCNIENAAFTPTNCAERTAFFKAVSEGERDFTAIAVAGGPEDASLPLEECPPCGVCLQVMMEFCDPARFMVLLVRSEEDYSCCSLGALLPRGFGPSNVEESK